ncbi:PHD finger protein 20 isoform 3-T3 [Discoglossus pictus]
MTKHPPNRRGITFEVGSQLEARDRLKKWYAAHIEEIDYEEGKVLIHFKRWNHRYDEWFCWDSPYLRPLEKIQLRREGLVEDDPQVVFRVNEQVLACWSDCRFYPAKITSVNKDGTYTVKFFDGVIQTVKNIHVKAYSKDQTNVSRSKPKERGRESTSPPAKHREKFREQKKTAENNSVEKEKPLVIDKKPAQPEKEKKVVANNDKNKLPEKNNAKEDKENISENEREPSGETHIEEKTVQNESLKVPHENGERKKRDRSSSVQSSDTVSVTLQPITLELRRRKISIGSEVQTKRPRLDKSSTATAKVENGLSSEETLSNADDNSEKESRRRSSRLSSSENQASPSVIEATPASPATEENLSKEADSLPKEPEEGPKCLETSSCEAENVEDISDQVKVQAELSPTDDPKPTETDPTPILPDVTETEAETASIPNCVSDNKAEDKDVPMQNETPEVTAPVRDTPLQISLRSSPQDSKDRLNEKRRHSTPATNTSRPSLREKSKENQIQKTHRKPDKPVESVKEKPNETLEDILKLKSKKKKKKKKKSKSEFSGSEENIDISKELSPKKTQPSKPNDMKTSSSVKTMPQRSSDHGRRRESTRISDDDMLSDSCTESLLWSDDDYNEEIDVTNADEELEEEDGDCEIVRCMCEVQEENDFMIQCEECLCWQHGVCMGLLEDNVPEKYTCYVCQDPPGQRLSLKYWYDKEWLNDGHMHGLSFLEENYSHQNAKKIVATHQLLGDVQHVIEVLHGLQLKMSILQSKDHPDLKYWGQPWKQHTLNERCYIKRNPEENSYKEDANNYRTYNGVVDKPSPVPSVEESYITSEHCYQKPRTYYPAVEQRLVVETRSSTLDAGVDRIQQSREDSLAERLGWELDRELIKTESESKHNYCKVRECISKKNPPQESTHTQTMDNGDGTVGSQLQWQLNLLAHLESLQDEVTHRMDFIEKELDVLESFLDYTGELEPPEPLARLPQLKHRIKQLLTDLGKVEQIALCCST